MGQIKQGGVAADPPRQLDAHDFRTHVEIEEIDTVSAVTGEDLGWLPNTCVRSPAFNRLANRVLSVSPSICAHGG